MYKILAIMGKAGSGKDSLMKALIDGNYISGAKPIIGCTTRPIREYEVDGVNYHYLTNEEFAEQVLNGEMLEATIFNEWCYGTSVKNLDENVLNIGVFNPEAIEILKEVKNIDLTIVYIVAGDKTRLLRQLNREENPNCDEVVRRFGTDKIDFRWERIQNINPNKMVQNDNGVAIDDLAKDIALWYDAPFPNGIPWVKINKE